MSSIALVLDAEQRSALAIVRSLSRRRIEIETASAQASPLAGAARGASHNAVHPSPEQSVSAFISWIDNRRIQSVIPVTDSTSMLIRRTPGAIDDGYDRLTNKATLLDLAGTMGIPTPRWAPATSINDAISIANQIGFPIVLKPARSRIQIGDRIVATAVRIAENPDQVEHLLSASSWFPTMPILMQEWVPGYGQGVFCLFDRDHSIAWFAHRRIREKPPAGGVSVLCESVAVDPVLRDYSESLLSAAEFRGVAMVEFRIDPAGLPFLMEVNARFWGSLQLAVDCGVDFPWLYWQLMHGERVTPVAQYRIGQRLRWLLGDLDSLLIALRDPAYSAASKRHLATEFLLSTLDRRCRQEVLRLDDPFPALREFAQWASGVIGLPPK